VTFVGTESVLSMLEEVAGSVASGGSTHCSIRQMLRVCLPPPSATAPRAYLGDASAPGITSQLWCPMQPDSACACEL